MLTLKQLKQRNIVENLLSEIQVCLTLAIILEISYSDLETGKYGPNLESPRLPRRVDSTAHITKNILPIACTVINEISSLERFPHNSIDLLCMQQ